MNNVSIQQQMKYLVSNVQTKLLGTLQAYNPKICQINYQYGRLTEILNTLQTWTSDPAKMYKRYPLIALLEDFPVFNGTGYWDTARLNIIIAYQTDRNYKSADRQVHSFLPVINLLYNELMDQIYKCGYFVVYNPFKDMIHERIDHPNWSPQGLYTTMGLRTNNAQDDWIDATEIKNLTLKIETNYCLQTNFN